MYSSSAATSLGNFLSGMETRAEQRASQHAHRLGNFLSGMETTRYRGGRLEWQKPWKLP